MDDLLFVIIFALIGLVTKKIRGVDIYEVSGYLVIVTLTTPLINSMFIHDPVLLQKFGNDYLSTLIQMFPDVLIGYAGSLVALAIFNSILGD